MFPRWHKSRSIEWPSLGPVQQQEQEPPLVGSARLRLSSQLLGAAFAVVVDPDSW